MGQESVSSPSTDLASLRTAHRRVRLPVLRAAGGDHSTIYYFLQTVFQGPPRAEFNASLEDPFYEPYDRLLLRRQRRIVAHGHITHRTMYFDSVSIPAAGLGWLGVAPEYRGQGLGTHLLRAAESRMAISGALVGMLRTSIPHFFRRTGWALCGQASYRRANARELLARLLERGLIPRPRRRLHIRPWLQWEQAALARIYHQNVNPAGAEEHNAPGPRSRREPRLHPQDRCPRALAACPSAVCGPLERTDPHWQWLLKRHAYDEVYVALDGPEQLELGEISTRLVGYAVTRGEQIVELMTSPERPRAAAELLARCCGDAIEHDRHCVLLHAPPACPWFEIFAEAGGSGPLGTLEHGEVYMMRLLNPLELLRRLCGQFERRAAEAHLSRPLDLGLLVEGQKYQVELGPQGVDATSQRVGRSYLRLNVADFTRLVMGQLDWDAAIADGRLECSTALASEAGRALFPSLPLWRPPWDELPSNV
jgi:predicted N-acetyltransferase YhbS